MLFRSLGIRPLRGRTGQAAARRKLNRRTGLATGVSGWVETLEDRTLLSVQFVFDYSYDTAGFFNDLSRRVVLDQVATDLGSRFRDQLDDLTATGGDTWTADFTDPATGTLASEVDLVVPADTLYVFAGARDLGGGDVGRGGYGGYSAAGDAAWLERVGARGQGGALLPAPRISVHGAGRSRLTC